MSFLKLLFGNYSKRELKRIRPIANAVYNLETKYLNMTDEELASQTTVLKERLKNGETVDNILVRLPTESLECAHSRFKFWVE